MKKYKITYYYDALCGWCYGFSPVMNRIYMKYKEKVDFEILSGGLFIGHRVGAINEIAPYIKEGAYKTVEQRTGIEFGKKFLENDAMILDSLPPAIALCIIKENYPEKTIELSQVLHKAIYFDGIDPSDIGMNSTILQGIGVNIEDLNLKMRDEKYIKMAQQEFTYVASQEVGGFPSVVLKNGTDDIILSRGYVDFDMLDTKLDQIIH
ncbi:DsbA family protein [Aquimarina algiphila]|uniref:DsbA family protein n=1 Tax=Aquimarina algiphila TaxID=2047982 RepID=UPI002490FB57|nr:DsbA family protein [Aquimarina algiphila]